MRLGRDGSPYVANFWRTRRRWGITHHPRQQMFALVGGLAFSTGTHGLRASAGPCVSRARTVTLAASRSAARSYGRPRRHGVLAGAQQEIDGKSGDSAPSVSGTVYSAGDDAPTVQLFTKAGCTLCDVAKGVLASASAERPHTLETVDITDEDKVRLTLAAVPDPDATLALSMALTLTLTSPLHDPDPGPNLALSVILARTLTWPYP
eukprot:scaffold50378_cov70-Phaeocystis_antarctica.AAC.2